MTDAVESSADRMTTRERPAGLTSAEASSRLGSVGPNTLPRPVSRPLVALGKKFWGPVPWMLEAAMGVEVGMGRWPQAGVVAALLVVNAVVSQIQEGRAKSALSVLESRLSRRARVKRDGAWASTDTALLVPGDAIHVRMGDIVPADARVVEGLVSIDRSSLTGESLPVDVGPKEGTGATTGERTDAGSDEIPSGAVVRRGEATAVVIATGAATRFGRVAALVVAVDQGVTQSQRVVMRMVRWLAIVTAGATVGVVAAFLARGGLAHPHAWRDVVPLVVVLLLAAVPSALPAVFTLTAALGARSLAEKGALVTRLSAVQDAASMTVLCLDKTGTLTQNRIVVGEVLPMSGQGANGPRALIEGALIACDAATQDGIDLAIDAAAHVRGIAPPPVESARFVPFDPATKRSEGVGVLGGRRVRVTKGAPAAVAAMCAPGGDELLSLSARVGAAGHRALAVAWRAEDPGAGGSFLPLGVLGLSDPLRPDAAALLASIRGAGVRTVMITGDSAPTASAIAGALGFRGPVCPPEELAGAESGRTDGLRRYDVFAGVLPEDKHAIVARLEADDPEASIGMTGDGVNDAPALRRAQVGIAVDGATDVARAAAAIVLTRPGLGAIADSLVEARAIHQRIEVYALAKLAKAVSVVGVLGGGYIATGEMPTVPHAVFLIMLINDFLTISIATDRVRAPPRPARWNVGRMTRRAIPLGLAWLTFGIAVFAFAGPLLGATPAQSQTLVFLALVFGGQAIVFQCREERWFWASRPGTALTLSSAVGLAAAMAVAVAGVLVEQVSIRDSAMVLGGAALWMLACEPVRVLLGATGGHAPTRPE